MPCVDLSSGCTTISSDDSRVDLQNVKRGVRPNPSFPLGSVLYSEPKLIYIFLDILFMDADREEELTLDLYVFKSPVSAFPYGGC
jgi:hypothetical protein